MGENKSKIDLSLLVTFRSQDVFYQTMRREAMYDLLQSTARGEAIMLVKLSIILFSNSHNFTYYAHRFYLLFSKLCLV